MSETVRLTTAQALVRFLDKQYVEVDGEESKFVEGVFHIFGHGNVLGLGQALEEDAGELVLYQGKNEQGMAQAAIAFAKEKLRRKIFAVTTSVGPGAANLVTAAGTALANNLPVLFLPGDTFATRQPDPVLQQVEQEYSATITTNDALKPLSRYWDRIQRPEQLMTALLRAFEVLTNPVSSGPVTIALAQDVEGEAYDYPADFFKKRVHYMDRRPAHERELAQALELLKNSKKPLLIVGGGAKYSDAGEVIQQLSLAANIPLAETQAGKSAVSSIFENNLGGLGVTGTSAANLAAKEADLIIGVGTRYTDFTSSSKTAFGNPNAKFLNINVSRMQTYKYDAVGVVADAKVALAAILANLDGYKSEFDTFKAYREEWFSERVRLSSIQFDPLNFTPEVAGHFSQEEMAEYAQALGTTLAQSTALIAANDWLDEDSIAVGASGSLPGDMQRVWVAKGKNTYNMEYGYSTMGYEIAGAFGAKIAHPDKEVYSFVGDGSFHMLHSEFVSSIQYNKKITLVLFDNSGFGCINNLQMNHGSSSFGTEFRQNNTGDILTIDFAKVAQGYGAKAYSVSSVKELLLALKEAKSESGSVLIHVKVLPKTMTEGYESWWNTGVAHVTAKGYTSEVLEERAKKLASARFY